MLLSCTAGKRGIMKQKKTLQDLSLIDNFLFGAMMTDPDVGIPFSRKLIKLILGKEISDIQITPQKVFYGVDTDMHGARLDVYIEETVNPDGETEEMAQIIEDDSSIFDIEPEKNHDTISVEGLPKRVRFYHAKIDAGNLTAGDTYGSLRNVIVIFITTYDPFGLNRMVYTIKNGCIEVPELEYEDGAQTIFLYTRGREGNPPEELKQLLHYMEHSSVENASTENLKKLHRMVTAVKRDGEVGLAYMKSFEREERIRKQGEEEGEIVGKTKEVIKLGRRFGKSEKEIILLLQEELHIDKDKATDFLEKYDK